jgi:hypothetical protein
MRMSERRVKLQSGRTEDLHIVGHDAPLTGRDGNAGMPQGPGGGSGEPKPGRARNRIGNAIGAGEPVAGEPAVIRQLAYLSRRRPGLTDAQIEADIALPAILHNRQLGVTGCLWHDATRFFQVLEGSPEAIGVVMGLIREDDRHHDLHAFKPRRVEKRMFGQFHMRQLVNCSPPKLLALLASDLHDAPIDQPGDAGLGPTDALLHEAIDELAAWP